MNIKTKWKKYPPSQLEPESDGFYQKLIREIGDEEVYANLVEWTVFGEKRYELKIQIDEHISITGKTINIDNFSYSKLNFKLIERHANSIIESLSIFK